MLVQQAYDVSAQLIQEARSQGIQRFVVGAVVEYDGKVLVLRRKPDDFLGGIYELPSGKVEAGELLFEALRREVHEETGLEIAEIKDHVGYFDYLSSKGLPTRQFNFIVNCLPGSIQLSEHDDYQWIDPADQKFEGITESVRKVLSNTTFRSIISVNSIKKIYDYINDDCLLFFDLDHTLIQNETSFGNEVWEKKLVQALISSGIAPNIAYRSASDLWGSIQMVSDSSPVEETTVELIWDLKKRGYHIVGLTARSPYLHLTTVRQLQSLGIQFCYSEPQHLSQKIYLSDGVIFCGDAVKGDAINLYLKATNQKPRRIIMIDDRLGHLEEAKKIVEAPQFIGLNYTFLDQSIANIELDLATETLIRIFSNSEALSLFRNGLDLLK